MDYTLKFSNEEQAINTLIEAGLLAISQQIAEDGETTVDVVHGTNKGSIDVLGIIIKDEVPIDGWHINVRSQEEVPELEPFHVNVKTPQRVWA